VSSWAILLLIRGTNVLTPHRENIVSMDITFFETRSYFSSSQTPLQEESKIEDDFLTLLLVHTPMPEQKQQQLTNDSPTVPTDKPFAPPVEEL
jgi:hypothetical protein